MTNRWTCKFMEPELQQNVTLSFSDYTNNPQKLKNIMSKYGFAVVTNILSSHECKQSESTLYTDLLNMVDTSVQVDPKLQQIIQKIKQRKLHWPKSSIPGLVGKGFMCTHGMPQSNFSWNLRTNPKVHSIFKFLHQSDDLVVSLDLPFFSPNTNAEKSADMWPHADQNINVKRGCENSYQGILYVYDGTKENTSNTVLWPKSWNNEYKELLAHSKPMKLGSDISEHALYLKQIDDETIKTQFFTKWKQNARRIQVPAGGLLIFNSRTIHQGYPSGSRLAQTISWEPRENRDMGALKRKLQATQLGFGTTHWGSLGIHHGASFIRSYKKNGYSRYSEDYDKCYIPMKFLPSSAVKKHLIDPTTLTQNNIKFKVKDPAIQKIQKMLDCVKDEYKDLL